MSKGLEALEQGFWKLTHKGNIRFYNVAYKELMAFEIMGKEPFVSPNWYLEGTYEEYVDAIETVRITKDEWDFVKEVLS